MTIPDYVIGDPIPTDFQPPKPYSQGSPDTTEPGGYMRAINKWAMKVAADANNHSAYDLFSRAWTKWIAQLEQVTDKTSIKPPQHPIYQTVTDAKFAAYWDAYCQNPDAAGNCGFCDSTQEPFSFNLPGSIGVANIQMADTSVNIVDRVAPSIQQPENPIGAPEGNGYFAIAPGDVLPAGATYFGPSGAFVKNVYQTPFGTVSFWKQLG